MLVSLSWTRSFFAEALRYNSDRAGIHIHTWSDAGEGWHLLWVDGQRAGFSCPTRDPAPLFGGRDRVR